MTTLQAAWSVAAAIAACGLLILPLQLPERGALSMPAVDRTGGLLEASERLGHRAYSVVGHSRVIAEAPNAQNTLLAILGPTRAPSDSEQAVLEAFIANGGNLWIADPAGNYNNWLARRGVLVSPTSLLDPTSANPRVVNLTFTTPEPDVVGVSSRLPSPLILVENQAWEPFLWAGVSTHADLDGNLSVDRSDPPGPHPVGVVQKTAGGGLLVITGDDTLAWAEFQTREHEANRRLSEWVIEEALDQGGIVVVDETQQALTGSERPLVSASRVLHRVIDAQLAWITVALGTTGAAIAVWRSRALRAFVAHSAGDSTMDPSPLDEGRLESIAAAIRATQGAPHNDGAATSADAEHFLREFVKNEV